jgi:hypothetical protein
MPLNRKQLQHLRGELSVDDFVSAIRDEALFVRAVDIISEDTRIWAESVGLGKKKPDPKLLAGLSDIEKLVAEYFSSRSLRIEEYRDRADFIDLILGVIGIQFGTTFNVTPHKFIPVSAAKKDGSNIFRGAPRWFSIIPIGNSNSHDYRIGVAVIRAPFLPAARLCNPRNGAFGNTMTDDPSELMVPSAEQIRESLARVLYYNLDMLDAFSHDFLD